MSGITQKMLTQQLRELEEDGVIERKVYNQVPPKVEYSLTEYGHSLDAILDSLCNWENIILKRMATRLCSLQQNKQEKRTRIRSFFFCI